MRFGALVTAAPGACCHAVMFRCCMPSRESGAMVRCVPLVQSSDFDANGGTSKQSTMMFGGKPDMSRLSLWSVKCALFPCPLTPEPCKASQCRTLCGSHVTVHTLFGLSWLAGSVSASSQQA